jgi:hypothetical protein
MGVARYVDISTDLLHDLEERDARRRPDEESIEIRAIAGMLRKEGWTEDRIVERFGYSPTPIPPRVRKEARHDVTAAAAGIRR